MTLFSGVIAFNTSSSGLKAAHSYCIKTTTSFTGKFVILELLVFVFLDRAKSLHALGPGVGGGGGGGGGLLNNVLYGEAPPGGPTL